MSCKNVTSVLMLLGPGASWWSAADTVLGLGREELRPPRGRDTPSA